MFKHHIITDDKTKAFTHWLKYKLLVVKILQNYNRVDRSAVFDILTQMVKAKNCEISGVLLLLAYMLTFSLSQSSCKRRNHHRDKIVNENRTRLSTVYITRVCLESSECSSFNLAQTIKFFFVTCRGSRHLRGHQAWKKKKTVH